MVLDSNTVLHIFSSNPDKQSIALGVMLLLIQLVHHCLSFCSFQGSILLIIRKSLFSPGWGAVTIQLRKDIITSNVRAWDEWITYVIMLLTLESSSGSLPNITKANPCQALKPLFHYSGTDAAKVSFCLFSLRMFSFWSFSCWVAPPPEGRLQERNKGKIQANQLYLV